MVSENDRKWKDLRLSGDRAAIELQSSCMESQLSSNVLAGPALTALEKAKREYPNDKRRWFLAVRDSNQMSNSIMQERNLKKQARKIRFEKYAETGDIPGFFSALARKEAGFCDPGDPTGSPRRPNIAIQASDRE